MKLVVYTTGKAEVYIANKVFCSGKVGARTGEFGYNPVLAYILKHFTKDEDNNLVRKEK